jgi:hypothetical protein
VAKLLYIKILQTEELKCALEGYEELDLLVRGMLIKYASDLMKEMSAQTTLH